ncbi:hypothetical protein AUJ10_01425 [Candidatus Pacearchaeota archaeon CG1_02_31_27]|nr:MAG: hypothetical protein AUJ10_01425 [Candidatus Pacearchaeota archaeon CG1_02_31_27]PIN92003.1 MAG: hypothetical protein COU55_02990 [Candidatus Pacearchaeota archaeon CG10_big_fil_rev_8_21_14_0_10_31_59]PIZ81156.1 MAG: hypothetical protein COX99_00200 [Candidatus Pacearchaeota archaeon CG_4_10_14_0_2_um_filter_31_10]
MAGKIPIFTEWFGKPKIVTDEGVAMSEEFYFMKFPNNGIGLKYLFRERLPRLNILKQSKLTDYQFIEYKAALQILEKALYLSRIEKRHLTGKILDFGCGAGGSSIVLKLLSEDIIAIDINLNDINTLKNSGFFPEERALNIDGFYYMTQQPEESYDLVLAINLGELNTERRFIEEFYRESMRVVKPDGKILIHSDLLTMDKVRDVFGVEERPSTRTLVI